MVTSDSASIIGLESYGLFEGARASFVVLDAGDPVEALRLRADRLWVVSNGAVVASAPRRDVRLDLADRHDSVRRRREVPGFGGFDATPD